MIYADFENILVPEENGKQNPNKLYTNKYQKHVLVVMAINWYVLVINLVSLLSHIQVKMFTDILLVWLKKVKYCNNMIKKHFNKEILMVKMDNEDLKNAAKCSMSYNFYFDGDVKSMRSLSCHWKIKKLCTQKL